MTLVKVCRNDSTPQKINISSENVLRTAWYLGILVSWYLGILVSWYLGILVSCLWRQEAACLALAFLVSFYHFRSRTMTAGYWVKWAQFTYIHYDYVCLVAVCHDAGVASSSYCHSVIDTLYSLAYAPCSLLWKKVFPVSGFHFSSMASRTNRVV